KIILNRMATTKPNFSLESKVTPEEILGMQDSVNRIYVDEQIKDYVLKRVFAARNAGAIDPGLKPLIRIGASPRATINLTLAARAWAMLEGRAYVIPDDIKAIAYDVLRHRILLSYEAEAEQVT